MGRRYYCDYCDKSFVETPDAVKKHVRGLQHQKLRNEHYAKFEDKRKILENESKKITCKRFMENGNCMFGATCRFSHYTKQQLDYLRWEISQTDDSQLPAAHSTIDGWLISRRKRGLVNSTALEQAYLDNINPHRDNLNELMGWKYPENLHNMIDLPPSLKRLHVDDFKDDNFAQWG